MQPGLSSVRRAAEFVAPQVSAAGLGVRPRSGASAEAARLLFLSWERARAQRLAWADLLARPDSRAFGEVEALQWNPVF
jgi:hypothetical protein